MKKLIFTIFSLLFIFLSSYATTNNVITYDKNDKSIPLYLRYGYTDSIQFVRDQLAMNAYPYEKVVDYKWGGNTQNGWDCSGFIKYMYSQFNMNLPRTATEMAKLGVNVNFSNLLNGDLLFFGSGSTITHVAMVFQSEDGTKKIIHCASSTGVTINSFDDTIWKNYWSKKYLFSKRIVGVS
jgi:cell wall-associated NlpC family hydrolase